MAGIKANSASVTMADSDTTVDQNRTGFAANELVTLTVTGSPTSVDWLLAKPTTSAYATLALSGLAASVTPDIHGLYVITALVDGVTEYIIRLSVAVSGAVTVREAIHLPPVASSNLSAPAVGRLLFCDASNSHLSVLLPGGTVVDLEV